MEHDTNLPVRPPWITLDLALANSSSVSAPDARKLASRSSSETLSFLLPVILAPLVCSAICSAIRRHKRGRRGEKLRSGDRMARY